MSSISSSIPDSTSHSQPDIPSLASLPLSTLPPNPRDVNTSATAALTKSSLPSLSLEGLGRMNDGEETPASPTASEVSDITLFTDATDVDGDERGNVPVQAHTTIVPSTATHEHGHSGDCRSINARFLRRPDLEKERRERIALTRECGGPPRGRTRRRPVLQGPPTSHMSSPLSQLAASSQEQGTSESPSSEPQSTNLPTLSAQSSDTLVDEMGANASESTGRDNDGGFSRD